MAEVDKPDDQFDDAKGDPNAAKMGDRYEIAILTHVAICCAKDKTVKDFAITFNAKGHGNLDDIIVRQDKLRTFIQLKHKARMCNITPEYGNYEYTYKKILLPKYKKQIEGGFKLKIIFLSNANVPIPKNMKKLPIDEKNEKFFTGKGEVFQIAHQNGASGTEEFYKNLFIFSKQSAYSQYKDMLLNDLNGTVEIDQIKALYDYFEDAVVGRTKPFTKKEILKVLNLFILKPAMLFNDAKILTLNKYPMLFKNLLSFKLIVVTEKYKNLLLDIITQNVLDNLEFNTAVNCKEEIPQSLLDKVNQIKDVGILLKRNESPYIFEHLFVALWQIGQIPIALNYSEFKKQIDFSMSHFVAEDDGPVTLIVNDHSQAPPTNVSILRDLTSFDEATRKEFLQQINIKIGKSTWKLDEFIGEDISSINKITTDVLISLLCNSFDVDKIAEEAPIYVPRKVKIKLLKKDVLTTSNFLFVIDNDESQLDFRTYLGDQEKYSNKNVINSKLSLFETKEKMKFINRDYCLLRQFGDNYMVYGYKGPLSSLEEYFQEEELPENKIMDNLSMVNIIAADAGMGKTYLLKNAVSYLFDMKLLPIYLNLGDTCEELNNLPQDLTSLTDYLADKFTGNYDKTIDSQALDFFKSALKHNIEERKIVLLLDGFDEAPLDFRVIDFFSSLHIKVIITTRMHRLQPILEHCQCLAFTLMTFTSQDQKDFFKFHYGNVEDEKVDKIIEILNKNIESSLMTIPLQTKHVVEIFTDINKLFEEIDNINVLFLYEKFIEKHLNVFDKGRKINELLTEKSACVLLMDTQFSEEYLGIDEDEWKTLVLEFKDENVKNFIITGFNNDIPQFIHRTYAEFLCAKYLARKKRLSSLVIDRLLKEENLLKVRHFFDIIICQNLELHSAILLKKSNQIISLLNIKQHRELLLEKLQEKDKFNRTPLHLALSYGRRHSQIYSRYFHHSQSLQSHLDRTETEFMVFQDILQQLISVIERTETQFSTDVWDNYPWDYATKTRSFDSLEELISKFPKCFTCDDRKNVVELIFVAAVYDYPHLFNSIEQSGNFTETIIDADFQNKLSNYLNVEDERTEKWFLSNICAREGSVKVLETMLKKGLFEVNERYNAGNGQLTALETAVNYWNVFSKGQKYASLISMLMKNKATDIYRKLNEENILHKLAYKIGYDSNKLIIKMLPNFLRSHDIKYVNSVNGDGTSPLMLAVKYGHTKVSISFISILIDFGGNRFILDKEYWNIWHYFATNNLAKKDIISYICNYLKDAKHLINNCDKNNTQPLLKIICDERNTHVKLIEKLSLRSEKLRSKLKDNVRLKRPIGNILENYNDNLLHSGSDESECMQDYAKSLDDIFKFGENSAQLLKSFIENGAKIISSVKLNIWHYLGLFSKHLNNIELKNIINTLYNYGLNELNEGEISGVTPLLVAVQCVGNDSIELIKYFIEIGADIYKRDKFGRNIWHHLSYNKNLNNEGITNITSVLNSSFSEKAQNMIDEENEDGITPLMMAVQLIRNDSTELIKYFIENGCNIRKKDKRGHNIWHHLSCNKNLNIEGIKNITSVLNSRVSEKAQDIIDEQNEEGMTPLMVAVQQIRNNSVELIKYFIENGSNIRKKDKRGQNIFHHLCCNNNLNNEGIKNITSVLKSSFSEKALDKIDEQNEEGITPLLGAVQLIQSDSTELIKYFIENGCNIRRKDKRGRNIWHHLSLNKNLNNEGIKNIVSLIKSSLSEKARDMIVEETEDGITPLMMAVQLIRNDSTELIKYFIENGCNIRKKDKSGHNFWHHLSYNKNLNNEGIKNIVSLIKSSFSEKAQGMIDEENGGGITPLMVVVQQVRNDSVQLIKYFIENGCNIRKKDKSGHNFWHHLSYNKNLNNEGIKNIVSLIKSSFSEKAQDMIDKENKEGITPLLGAVQQVRNDSVELIKYFIENGCNIRKKDKGGHNFWHHLSYNKNLNNEGIKNIVSLIKSSFSEKAQDMIVEETEDGITPLMMAVQLIRNDSTELIKYFIENDCNIRKKDKRGLNIWHHLSLNKNLNNEGIKNIVSLIKSSLSEKAQDMIVEETEDGITPLLVAVQQVRNDSVELIKYFIENGSNIRKNDKRGRNIWHHLSFNKNLNNEAIKNITSVLNSSFSEKAQDMIDEENEEGITPLFLAVQQIRNVSVELIKYFIENGCNIRKKDKRGQNIWHHLSLNKNLNNEGIKNITFVLKSSFSEKAQDMIDEQDEKGITPLMLAVKQMRNDSVELIKYFIENDCNIRKKDKRGRNIWHHLSFNKNLNNEGIKNITSVLNSSFSEKAQDMIDERNEEGITPLMLAVNVIRNDSVELIKYFLENGSNIRKKDKEGQNIWHHLSCNKNLNNEGIKNITSVLKSSFKGNMQHIIDEENIYGATPLMIALNKTEDESIHLYKYFIENGANICKRDMIGQNILHYLFENENQIKIEMVISTLKPSLIKNGRKLINERDFYGVTPLKLALEYISNDCLHLIYFFIEVGGEIPREDKSGPNNIWYYLHKNKNLSKEDRNKVVQIISQS